MKIKNLSPKDIKEQKLSIVIVNYNTKSYLVRCLKSIIKWWPKYSTEIVLVDNNSDDNTIEAIKKLKINDLKIIENKRNLGFSKGVNIGLKKANGTIFLLLNPDTIIIKNAINKIVDFALKNNEIGIVGGKTLMIKKNKIHRTYFNKINFLTALFEFTNLKKIFPKNIFFKDFYYIDKDENTTRDVYGVSGRFMLIKKLVIKKIGYLEEKLFLYLEDIDFCLRAKEKKIDITYYPKAIIRHEFGATSKKNRYRINIKAWGDSRKIFFRKHFGLLFGNILIMIFNLDDLIINFKHLLFNENEKD